MFDTETTGIPPADPSGKCKYAPYKTWGNRCRLLQLAWQVRGDDGALLDAGNLYVIPDGFSIPEESSAVHGITMDVIQQRHQEGRAKPLAEVLDVFFAVFEKFPIQTLVAHNLAFDYHILHHELYRLGRPVPVVWTKTPGYCTYRRGMRYLKNRTPPVFISGKLVSYYSHFVEPWENSLLKHEATLHQADSDVEVCWRLYDQLRCLS